MPVEERVNNFFSFLDKPKKPKFFTLYFEDVDHAGHSYGNIFKIIIGDFKI